jgi:uncharacterized protein YfaS (alpha-2-macroglobulin family)
VALSVIDSMGTPVTAKTFSVHSESGGQTSFDLPKDALAGGYTLRMSVYGAVYSGSFRVAEYAKPHFEIDLALAQPEFKTGEPVRGKVRLTYPGGKPVKNAKIELSLRSEALNMVGDRIDYPYQDWFPIKTQGLFPQKLVQHELVTNDEGWASIELPMAREPSRYILNLRAHDQEAYRVTAIKEILIQAGTQAYALVTARQLSRPAEDVVFDLRELHRAEGQASQWEAIRLEDQSRLSGTITQNRFSVRFEKSGSYTVSVKSAQGDMMGSAQHWVAGPDLKSPPGSIDDGID